MVWVTEVVIEDEPSRPFTSIKRVSYKPKTKKLAISKGQKSSLSSSWPSNVVLDEFMAATSVNSRRRQDIDTERLSDSCTRRQPSNSNTSPCSGARESIMDDDRCDDNETCDRSKTRESEKIRDQTVKKDICKLHDPYRAQRCSSSKKLSRNHRFITNNEGEMNHPGTFHPSKPLKDETCHSVLQALYYLTTKCHNQPDLDIPY